MSYKLRFIKTDKNGYIQYKKEHLRRLYKRKKGIELTDEELEEKVGKRVKYETHFTIYFDEGELNEAEIIELLKRVKAVYKIIETEAIDM